MKTKHFIVALVLSGVLAASNATVAQAQTLQEQRQLNKEKYQQNVEKYQAEKEEFRANAEQRVENRCSIATSRIELHTTRYENNQTVFNKVYDRLTELAPKVIEQAKTAGKDTQAFESALAEMQKKSDSSKAEYSVLMSLLEETKSFACGESEGVFKDALQKSRQQLVVTRQAILDARSYYQTTVRTAAQELLQ